MEAKKSCFSKISVPEKCDFLSFQGPYGAPLRIFLAKNGSKSSVTPLIEKSWPFGPIKIAFKMSYWRFSLGGVLNTPPTSNRVKRHSWNSTIWNINIQYKNEWFTLQKCTKPVFSKRHSRNSVISSFYLSWGVLVIIEGADYLYK